MDYTIEVVSAMPPGVNHGHFPSWKRIIKAKNVYDALSQYKQQMAYKLPSNTHLSIKITDANGLSEEVVL